jgi:RNA polymerase sigma factor (sigma-70 family)
MRGPGETVTSTIRGADAAAQFGALIEQHRGIVLKVVSTYCRNPADRDDLAQEIAAQLWRSFRRFDPERTFSTWMYRIALNVAISFVRSRAIRERHSVPLNEELHDTADVGQDPGEDERVTVLYSFIDRLDALNRALLLLYLDERSYREIAEVLGISETNVATKINRLKKRLAEETRHGAR